MPCASGEEMSRIVAWPVFREQRGEGFVDYYRNIATAKVRESILTRRIWGAKWGANTPE